MVPIANVPFLARTIERLYAAGIRDVIFPAGYLPQSIIDYFGDGSRFDMRITYVIEKEPLGTAGALKNVEQYIDGPFFVLNGDILTSLDLTEMIRFHREKGGLGALHLIRVDDPSAFGCVAHDADGRIRQFVEKPPKGSAPTNEINAGTYLLEPDVLAMIPAGRNVSIERETFPRLLSTGKMLYAYTTGDYWIDLGRPEHYLQAHRDILSGAMPCIVEPGISGAGAQRLMSNAALIAPVHVDEGVEIDPAATVGPNVVLGARCRIGAGALVRDCVLWDDVIIGERAVVEETIAASRVRIGADARIGPGTVIGHDAIVPAASVLAPGSRVSATAEVTQEK